MLSVILSQERISSSLDPMMVLIYDDGTSLLAGLVGHLSVSALPCGSYCAETVFIHTMATIASSVPHARTIPVNCYLSPLAGMSMIQGHFWFKS